MRIAFFVLVLIHGLIHLSGFLKAFELAEFKQLSQPILKSMGIVWLLAFILSVATGILFICKNSNWWLVGLLGVVTSQMLIMFFWQDAKFGTIANGLILMAVVVGFATAKYYNEYLKEVKAGLQQPAYFQNSELTEKDIEHLPEAVKEYLRYSGSIGKPKVNNFKITFIGRIRKDEHSEWMPFNSEQYNFMETPTRLFFMKAIMKHLPVAGYHSFKNGIAFMDIRVFSIFKVQYQKGVEMDLSETVTFFNDMCCLAPPTLIDKRISWLEAERYKVKASFTNKGITVSAWLYFNEKGQLINFVSEDRYSADAGKQLPWSTPIKDYQQLHGYNLMRNADAVYSYSDRDLVYGSFELTKVEFNCQKVQ